MINKNDTEHCSPGQACAVIGLVSIGLLAGLAAIILFSLNNPLVAGIIFLLMIAQLSFGCAEICGTPSPKLR